MKTYLVIIAAAGLLTTVWLAGCLSGTVSHSEADRFNGTWKTGQGLIFIFHKNGTCMMQGWVSGTGTWNISDNKLFVTLEFTGGKNYMAYDYKFSNDDTVLTLTDASGNSWIYSKQ